MKRILLVGVGTLAVLAALSSPLAAQTKGIAGLATSGNPIAALQTEIQQLQTTVAAIQASVGLLNQGALIGKWSGLRFVGQFSDPATIVEQQNLDFTFNADGTFSSASFERASGEYQVMRNTVLLGPVLLQDVQIQGNTLSFYVDETSEGPGQGIALGEGAFYVLQRQP